MNSLDYPTVYLAGPVKERALGDAADHIRDLREAAADADLVRGGDQ